MNNQEKYDLITRNLQEIINPDYLKSKIESGIKPKGYWGTAPTGSIHIGYLIPALKLRDIINSGCELKILIADIHAFLDNLKTPFDKIQLRTQYYITMIKTILKTLGCDLTHVSFVVGSEYQLKPDIVMELFKLSSITSVSQATKAGTEVVKQMKEPKITSLLYPMLQSLDEKYLDVDFEIGGIDQRKIFTYGIEFMPKIGINRKCTYLMNPIVSGLSSKASEGNVKMSSSEPNSKIDLLDTPIIIKKKISKAFCEEKNIIDNSVLALYKNLVFKLVSNFILEREEKYGGNLELNSYESLEQYFGNGIISPADLKNNLSNFISNFLKPIRDEFDKEENINVYKSAYADI